MWRSINISPLRGVLQPQTQSNQRAMTFAAKPLVDRKREFLRKSVISDDPPRQN
jgi:hypothetical protein